ncbi:GGDEF domain-containing response regulator [Egbenema bharatensis]|uniref:GGDEF domain-containing response regulator n=1 Tax=Egbenema bharatensis TaxID=3463334 RepID=UPI003A8BFDBB
MDASVLLIGSDRFQASVLDLIRDLATLAIEVAADPFEATPLIQAQQPDLLLVQASQPDSLNLCRQLKSQNRLSWIYCIVIDEQLQDGLRKIEIETAALNAGADAYLAFPTEAAITTQQVFWNRLLQAYVFAGLRRVQNHRELMRTNDVLSAIALSDPLTELNNRRAFEWELPRQIKNARHRRAPISLLMLDVDYFKRINDTYGHLVGDTALQLLSARLRHNLRFYDTPFRYGGEEFVILLSDTGCQEAEQIAHRICQLIREQPFAIDENLELKITISAGVATLQARDDAKGNSLLQRADQRLLKAKALGRNRVVGSDAEA